MSAQQCSTKPETRQPVKVVDLHVEELEDRIARAGVISDGAVSGRGSPKLLLGSEALEAGILYLIAAYSDASSGW